MKAAALFLRVLAVGALVAALSGCGFVGDRVGERVAEELGDRAVDGEVDFDRDSGEIRIENSEGSFTIGGGDLPDAFPDEMPVPDGGEIVSTQSGSNDQGEQVSVQVHVTEGSFDELVAFFDDELASAGWEVGARNETSMGTGMRGVTFEVSGHGWEGGVQISQLGDSADDRILAVSYTLTRE